MKNKILITIIISLKIALLFSISPIFAQSSDIPYWYLDVTVDNRLLGTYSQQRVFFFRSLKEMESLTGFPRDDSVGGNSTSYKWVQPQGSIPVYVQQIFNTMRKENFDAAFILDTSGTNIRGNNYWNYTVFLMYNGIGYFDMKTRLNNPVRF